MERRFLKWGILSLFVLTALAGCSNADQQGSSTGVQGVDTRDSETLEVLLPSEAAGFSMENIFTNADPHYLDDVTVYLKYASEGFFTYAWTPAEIAARRKLIPNGGVPTLMFVAVNGETLTNGQFANTTQFNTAYDAITIESQNVPVTIQADDVNANIAGTYGTAQTAMIYGQTTDTSPHPTLENTRQAAVELSSAVSRFELGTVKAAIPAELTSVTVDAIYVNNYNTTLGLDNTVAINGLVWEANKPADGHWSKTTGDGVSVTSYDGTMCYAFQIFPELVPHFIYEISGTLADGIQLGDGTTGSFSGKYVSITGFSEVSAENPLERHTVYKVGLTDGGIPIDVTNITIMPEIGINALEVVITIAPWNEETLTPEIF